MKAFPFQFTHRPENFTWFTAIYLGFFVLVLFEIQLIVWKKLQVSSNMTNALDLSQW